MHMEEETISMLFGGFYLVIVLSLGIIIKSWFSNKNNSLIWFIGQLIFLHFAFLKFVDLLEPDPNTPESFISEANSLDLGIVGLLWGASMICMLTGIWNVNKRNKG